MWIEYDSVAICEAVDWVDTDDKQMWPCLCLQKINR